jgi:nicotinamide riboside kinase
MKNTPGLLVLTGPESSGKTTMARALGEVLSAPVVPEYARTYLQEIQRPYRHDDIGHIARGQRAWIEVYASQAVDWLVVDTDWTVLHIWEQLRFGPSRYFWPEGYGPPLLPEAYLLCMPDIPWAPDPLRENPDDRWVLLGYYERLLQQVPVPVIRLSGDHEGRMQTIRAFLDAR